MWSLGNETAAGAAGDLNPQISTANARDGWLVGYWTSRLTSEPSRADRKQTEASAREEGVGGSTWIWGGMACLQVRCTGIDLRAHVTVLWLQTLTYKERWVAIHCV